MLQEPGRLPADSDDLPGDRDQPRLEALVAPDAVVDYYRSVDSAPARFALNRPARAVNSFMVSFVALSMLGLLSLTIFVNSGYFESSRDLVFTSADGDRVRRPPRAPGGGALGLGSPRRAGGQARP